MNYNNVEFETSYGRPDQLPAAGGPEIAFSGRSNVGKSSMINTVFSRRRLARVSSSPGKTSTINFFRLENMRFADLPGYGYAKVSKTEKERWGRLMEAYFSGGRDIAMVMQLVDMRHPPTRDDLQMIDFMIESEIPFAIVLTKCDKLSKAERARRLEALAGELPCADQLTLVEFSAKTGEGVPEIRALIDEIAGAYTEDAPDSDGE